MSKYDREVADDSNELIEQNNELLEQNNELLEQIADYLKHIKLLLGIIMWVITIIGFKYFGVFDKYLSKVFAKNNCTILAYIL